MNRGSQGASAESSLRTWRLVLAYDGADYCGWQVQPDGKTIQGELAAAIERVSGERVLPQGSGRTDAGVHALGQVASFQLAAPIPEERLALALNRTLPPAIRILEATHATEDFHARHSARWKTYEYRIYRGEICPPFLARYVHAFSAPLDLNAMKDAADAVVGEHDFTSFAAVDPDLAARCAAAELSDADFSDRDDPENVRDAARDNIRGNIRDVRNNVRRIESSVWELRRAEDQELLVYTVRGDGFLHHMVRNLVGTFLLAGSGKASASMKNILEQRTRSAAGPTAPACGLYLVSVEY